MSEPTPARDPSVAEIRVRRALVLVWGITGFVFLLLTAGDIAGEAKYLQPWWSPIAAFLIFGPPPILALTARVLGPRPLRVILSAYAIGFSLVVITFAPAMLMRPMPDDLGPWPLAIMALGPVAAACVWRPLIVWGLLLVNTVAMVLVRDYADNHTSLDHSLQHALFAVAFTAVFTGMAMVAISNARTVDRAAMGAQHAARRASSAEARLRERARLDALVHDEVMTALFYATMGTPELDSAVTRQARRALDQLQSLGSDASTAPVSTDEFVARLRAVSLELSERVQFRLEGVPTGEVPSDMAAAFVEATGEAVRNSLAYASTDDSHLSVEVVLRLAVESVVATISDRGRGFNLRAVPAHRLGIRVSIEGRLAIVSGCRASVESRPGHGARVTLRWDKP